MKSFTIEILHNNLILELAFDKVPTTSGSKFLVTSLSHHHEMVSFDMKQDIHGDWNVVAPAPHWIQQLEFQFNQLLKEQSKYQMIYN